MHHVIENYDDNNDKRFVDAIEVIKKHIDVVYPCENGNKTEILNSLDLIQFNTIVFSSHAERLGFNDFMGCFDSCPYTENTEGTERTDWCRGYLKASRNSYINEHKDHYDGCHFDKAESIVNSVLLNKS
ncbi:hypothetical protein [Moritella sp. F3]|uniref:hypothetical protein n=1 Tax=Moritella sp. F3 TaxID=2718882 RepID=UPI0018E11FBB|nr:hypothetical protein [Moritella sp. F3]GIC77139.1 hypothetical protein FMO001_18660 [Moritella sp. F1]GIC82258.1 hypothetical protein FMO003_25390 [Moritella sp. F3]